MIANKCRCMLSKEIGTLAPPSASPYMYMLYKKEELENLIRERLQAVRGIIPEHNLVNTEDFSDSIGSST